MEEFENKVADTLFILLRGRIYSSENFPHILKDEMAVSIKDKIPKEKEDKKQSQYTQLASAVRSFNMDKYIKQFMNENPEGIIVEIGCGLETTYYRNDDSKHQWYALDLPEVIDYREKLLKNGDNQTLIRGDILKIDWMNKINEEANNKPVLISAGGLFHYFPKDQVLTVMKNIQQNINNAQLIFDTLNHLGIKGIKKYMKQIGHEEATMYFYVDDGKKLAKEIGGNAQLLQEQKYYKDIPKDGMEFMTKTSMRVSDAMDMVKMIHLKLN
ncbi:hypothetical protein PIROE2DRAFT_60573 [Piromyces sp. E2]|nr:hypothetical protein PIROE2DRAFT_60573 [Piromyces sp. E2]|eukprot:OUM64558.1 hypothetical protein PIROE2DRAFT_60573 [Piromyces sp. E2]